MPEDEPSKWNRLLKPSLNKKNVSKKMRKVEGATVKHAHKFVIKRWGNILEVQRHVFIWIFTMGLLIASTGLQLMWSEKSYTTSTSDNYGTYAEAILGPIDSLNPIFASSSAEQSTSYLMFSRLLNYDVTGHLGYDLVKNIKIDDKKTIYTVTIRTDAKWHDGSPLTVDDIAFTISLLKDPILRTADSGWDGVTVKVKDKKTIEFSLQSTFAAFEHALTFPILPKHILGKVPHSQIRENKFSRNPIGSGPFKGGFIQNTESVSGPKVIYMSRNETYYGVKSKLSLYQLHTYETTDEILKAISAKEVNSAVGLSSVDIEQINSKNYNINNSPINSGVYALLNTKSELLKDINLRRALQLGTNTEMVRNKLLKGTPALDLPFVNNQISGDLPKVSKYDPVNAGKILNDGGWALNGHGARFKDGRELKINLVTMKNSELERIMEVIAGQWRAIGFTIETQVLDPKDASKGVVQNVIQPRNYDVFLSQLNLGADPDIYAYWHSSQATLNGLNFSNYSSTIGDDALSSARTRLEPELRNAKYITFAKQWVSDIPAIGLYQSTIGYVSSKNIKSFEKSNVLIAPVDRYSDVSKWSVASKKVYKTP